MKSIDERVELIAEEGKVLHDYLFSTEIWGIYELNLFSVSSPFLSVSLLLDMYEKWYVNLIF